MGEIYRYELHLHTAQGSKCGKSTAAEMVDFYCSRGYAGMVVTDHFYHGSTAPSREQPWESYIAAYEQGCLCAKKAAEGRDFDVLFGVEEKGTGGDEYIVLGLPAAWYAAHPELRDIRGTAFLDMARAAGGFVIHAHPFRERRYMLDTTVWLYPNHVDAVEVRNCGNQPAFDRRALEYARRLDLPMTGGTDNHNAGIQDRVLSGITLPFRVDTEAALIAAIRENKHAVIGLEEVSALPLTSPTFTVKGFDL